MTVSRVVALAQKVHDHIKSIPLPERDRHEEQLVERMRASVAPFLDGSSAPASSEKRPELEFEWFGELAKKVDSAPPRRYLIRGLFPARTYGVLAAEHKLQKTFITEDLAVSVASGTNWLGHVPIDDPGTVVMFSGEGGPASIVRRMRAIAESRDIPADSLEIAICTRSPHLNDESHLDLIRAKLDELSPKLVTLDPLFLAARGAQASSLYEMGALLENIQHVCQDAGASLWVVTHHNRKQGRGASRISGAGPAEWGRVLISITAISKHTDPETRATTVLTEIDFVGGEIADQTLRVRRRIWADDPDDLSSPLHVETTVTEGQQDTSGASGFSPAAMKLLKALEALDTENSEATSRTLGDWMANKSPWKHALRRETMSRELQKLNDSGLVESIGQGKYNANIWELTDAGRELAPTVEVAV